MAGQNPAHGIPILLLLLQLGEMIFILVIITATVLKHCQKHKKPGQARQCGIFTKPSAVAIPSPAFYHKINALKPFTLFLIGIIPFLS